MKINKLYKSYEIFTIMKNKNQGLILLAFLIIALVILTIIMFTYGTGINVGDDENLIVATTFWPLYDLTKSITGDSVTVFSIVPAGVEPHAYEPSPRDIQKLNNADIFVTLGIEFEEFEEDLVLGVNQDVKVVQSGTGITLLKLSEEEDHEEEHEDEEHNEEEHEDEHGHSGEDPHIWLSPRNAQQMVNNIMNGLLQADPENSEIYLNNGQQLINDLAALDQEYRDGLSSCNKDVILVNHNAFSYLGRDYSFDTIEISGLEPEVEPTPQQLVELIEEAEEHELKYVFYEELVDSRVAKTIAKEVGALVLPLSPIASDLGVSYTDLMRQNLANLKIALEC